MSTNQAEVREQTTEVSHRTQVALTPAELFRKGAETRDADISWSVVGPGHMRAYLSLVAVAGYAAVKRTEKHPYYDAPFKIYTMGGHPLPDKTYETVAAAKRAVRVWVKEWLASAGDVLTWKAEDTGVHFTASVNGIEVASYYYCREAVGNWHPDFRVWFGGTYYVTDFASQGDAREAVGDTYRRWLAHARASLEVMAHATDAEDAKV